MRDETVEEEAEDHDQRTARTLPWVGIRGAIARNRPSSSDPPSTTIIGMSRSVRSGCSRHAPPKILQAFFAERDDDRRERARQRDEAGRQHRAGADVADVGAPDLSRAHLRDEERPAGGRVDREVRMDRRERRDVAAPRIDSSGSSTSHDSTPPATMVPAIRGPIT